MFRAGGSHSIIVREFFPISIFLRTSCFSFHNVLAAQLLRGPQSRTWIIFVSGRTPRREIVCSGPGRPSEREVDCFCTYLEGRRSGGSIVLVLERAPGREIDCLVPGSLPEREMNCFCTWVLWKSIDFPLYGLSEYRKNEWEKSARGYESAGITSLGLESVQDDERARFGGDC